MPTYFRPARVDITESGGPGLGLALIGGGVVAAAVVVAFIAAHIMLLASAAACSSQGSAASWPGCRWISSPRRLQAHLPAIRASVAAARPTQPISAAPRPWQVVSVERVPDPQPRVIEPVNLTGTRHVSRGGPSLRRSRE